MKKLLRIAMLVCIYIFAFSTYSFAAFNDIEGHWCELEINDFEESGFVEGYLDESFKPDNEITRAEFCKIINSYMGYEVNGDWQSANMQVAKEKGYLTTGTAEELISREEAFTVLARVMQLNLQMDVQLDYRDSEQVSNWALPSVKALTFAGYVEGYENKMLQPKNKMTRAELVRVLYQYVGIGGLDEDIENLEFTVGYMIHNKYGLEYFEIQEELTMNIDETIMLAATLHENDGEADFEIISGGELVAFEKDDLILEAKKEGKVEILITTTNTKKEKSIVINIK